MDRTRAVSYGARTMKKLLVTLLFVAGCASSGKHTTSAGFPTRVDASEEQFLTLLDEVGWKVTEEEQDFHVDPRGGVGTRYELERADGKGFASLFIFDFEVGNGSLLMEVSEEIDGGSMLELIEGLRRIFDAAPTWRDRGVLHCVDHEPPHAVECPTEEDVPGQQEVLHEEYGCQATRWNPR